MPEHHLAQINIGRLKAPLTDPSIAEFVAQLEPVNRLADASPGFVWRLQSEEGDATGFAWDDDPLMIVNMSVWDSIEALKDFTYRSPHLETFRKRREWFCKMELPHYCLWWVLNGHRPTVAEGKARLEMFRKEGATQDAFWFSEPYPPPSHMPPDPE